VADTGTGIAPEIAQHLFQPFVTSKASGMGVGLSICRTIIEAHGGRINARANDGGGTVFEFTLPFAEPEAAYDR
jgi:two-component system sensor kinase FixL